MRSSRRASGLLKKLLSVVWPTSEIAVLAEMSRRLTGNNGEDHCNEEEPEAKKYSGLSS